ncbi:hypothetical protein SteCoe_1610 [Stentor coeruleus]|uniref:RNA methyltransferase n=1 Tax=Stentor coeruleus TaxID=5963 RepID=A0A1R2D1F3_9CILI|nr:hypothetical protein SteCoe_1610 [Stentor coeruleus]
MQKPWFEGKNVLDIGCNDGSLTILLSVNHNPKQITGVDIDYKLINRAVENTVYIETVLLHLMKNSDKIQALEELETFPISLQQYLNLPNHVSALKNFLPLKKILNLNSRFPGNIDFYCANFLDGTCKKYDTILCLSTSKWVHLNWGDSGLINMFNNIYNALEYKGIFIFEPQNWKSYKKSRTRTDQILQNYKSIKIKPDDFHLVLNNLGFEIIETICPKAGRETFKRLIYVYEKKEIIKS